MVASYGSVPSSSSKPASSYYKQHPSLSQDFSAKFTFPSVISSFVYGKPSIHGKTSRLYASQLPSLLSSLTQIIEQDGDEGGPVSKPDILVPIQV